MTKNQDDSNELRMEFDPKTIEHLGIHQYSTLPPVIAELVANSYDAEAKNVKIYLKDKKEKEIIIVDDGHGMTFKEINSNFLKIGRNRRIDDGKQKSKNDKRLVIGKKGIGKLAFFGIASKILVDTVHNRKRNVFLMDWEKLKEEGKEGNIYKPVPKIVNQETSDKNGTKITLKEIKRKSDFDAEDVSYSLSRYFSVFDQPDFNVKIFHNDISEVEVKNKLKYKNIFPVLKQEFPLNRQNSGYQYSSNIYGTLMAGKDTVPTKFEGVALFSRGKLVNDHSFYDIKASSHGYKYITGFLNIDFIDEWNKEVISTNRKSLVWEDEDTSELRNYLSRVIQDFYNKYRKWKEDEKKKKIKEKSGIDLDKWLQDLPKHERSLARKISYPIIKDDGINEEKASDLISYIQDLFKFETFKELAAEIADIPEIKDETLYNLLKEWELIEAKEFYKLSLVRVKTINSFEKYIHGNAREVPTLHKFLKTFPWLLDPRIMEFDDEKYYSTILKENYPEKEIELESNRRIDFLCTSLANSRFVIELKRPHHSIKRKDIEQARDYRNFVEDFSSNEPNSNRQVVAYIVCGNKKAEKRMLREDIETFENEGKIYVRTYGELLEQAKKYHKEFINKFEQLEGNINTID